MSWEEMSRDRNPCPCGQGTYSIINEMDDWNRSRSRWQMDCPKCKTEYQLYSRGGYDSSRLPTTHYLWVKKEQLLKHKKLIEQSKKSYDRAIVLAFNRYFETWIQFFKNKNKKEIWSTLTNKGETYPALGTFYKHLKDDGTERYLKRFFENENNRALQVLGIIDNEILTLKNQSESLHDEANNIFSNERTGRCIGTC